MHILVTRPETEAPRTKRKLEAMGHSVTIAPLLKIVTIAPPLDTSNVQALVLTSRNAVHSLRGHRDLETLRRLPVISVGKSTAEAARDAGFTVELEGDAGGAELAALIIGHYAPKDGYLLHISGEAIAYDLDAALAPHGFTIRRAIVYRSEPIDHLPKHRRGSADVAAHVRGLVPACRNRRTDVASENAAPSLSVGGRSVSPATARSGPDRYCR